MIMKFQIYFNEMVLTSNSNSGYKYLWQDLDLEILEELVEWKLISSEKLNKELEFSTAEEAFSFIENEKNNFAFSYKCVVIVKLTKSKK